jgi:hypothetical protein
LFIAILCYSAAKQYFVLENTASASEIIDLG